MPQPRSSIQPECLHLRQPLPPQKMQEIWTSALGSVKGKKLGKKRVLTAEPKRAFMAWSRVPLRSEKVMLVSTQRPSTWWKMGEWVASAASLRGTLPGVTVRTGGAWGIMVRIWGGEGGGRMSRRLPAGGGPLVGR